MELQKDLLQILACPRCHGALAPIEEGSTIIGLHCVACALVYPVRENIPVMLTEEAVAMDKWAQGIRQVQ